MSSTKRGVVDDDSENLGSNRKRSCRSSVKSYKEGQKVFVPSNRLVAGKEPTRSKKVTTREDTPHKHAKEVKKLGSSRIKNTQRTKKIKAQVILDSSESPVTSKKSAKLKKLKKPAGQDDSLSVIEASNSSKHNTKANDGKGCVDLSQLDVSQLLELGEKKSVILDDTREDQVLLSCSDEEEWEEVSHMNMEHVPVSNLEITVPSDVMFKRKHKKTREELYQEYAKKKLMMYKRKVQVYMHKANIVCLLSHYFGLNKVLNSENLIGITLSCISSEKYYPPKRAGLYYLEQFLKWFKTKVSLKTPPKYPVYPPSCLDHSDEEAINGWISGSKTLPKELKKKYLVPDIHDLLSSRITECVVYTWQELVLLFACYSRAVGLDVRLLASFQCVPLKPPSERACSTKKLIEPKKSEPANDMKDSDSEALSSDSSDFEISSKKVKRSNSKSKKGSTAKKKKGSRKIISPEEESPTNNELKLNTMKQGRDLWVEVYLEEEEKWISVDVVSGKVHCYAEITAAATSPIVYVVGFNNQSKIKDLTKKYARRWFSQTRKLRIDNLDPRWLSKTLRPYLESPTPRSKLEDEELNNLLREQPLPATMSEYKNHPLYVLRRHLLKFEAIYPSDAPPLGYIKSEPVYARECVHTLCSRETWLKEARLVRLEEQPYKIVNARPKFDKMTGQVEKNRPLEVFGRWQTEPYIPPVAHDGKVPRNEYGNVDLFKPSMLPIGTVLVDAPGINRLAKKLDIDCAQAIVGFDFHSGACHPVSGGWVICQEFHDTLMDAYTQEMEQQEKRAREKLEKRVYGNWRRLIKGLLIRERLMKKYDFKLHQKPRKSEKH